MSSSIARKPRENKPTNFKWGPEEVALAYYCFKTGLDVFTKEAVATKLGVSLGSLNAKIQDLSKLELYGLSTPMSRHTIQCFSESRMLTSDECRNRLDDFLQKPMQLRIQKSISLPLANTSSFVETFLAEGYIEFNGKYLNADNLIILKKESDLDAIPYGIMGCYFIFSNIPKERIPVFSKDGFKCYDQSLIKKDGIDFRCLYNGKGEIHQRIKHHLFCSQTYLKASQNEASRISDTGGISLEAISHEQYEKLKSAGKIPKNPNIKKSKFIQQESIFKGFPNGYFLNGINIEEEHWKNYQFAILPIQTDSELGKILIEESFAHINGRPPLCRRHG